MAEGSEASPQLPLELGLEAHAVFETFQAPADSPVLAAAKKPPAPGIWLTGPPGCGKSHLLQAICASVGDRPVAYVPLGTAPAPAMLEGLERLDIVCLDDVGAVAGDPEWERALFNLVNGILLTGGRVVCSAEGSPDEIGLALADLSSRCKSLVHYRLRRLDDEERLQALRRHAAYRGLELPEETARYLLRRVPRGMRELTALLEKLDSASMAAARRLTIPFVRELLSG